MAVLYKVFRFLTLVAHLPERDFVGGKALLPDHISGVGDVGEDVRHRTWVPDGSPFGAGDACFVQLVCDVILSLTAEISGINAAHHLGLFGNNH